jgi:putative hydrolase of the HAD superfamily
MPIKQLNNLDQLGSPKVIFLDAVGTLFGVKGSVGTNYALVAAEFGVDVPVADCDRAFIKHFQAAPRIAFPGAAPAQIPDLEKQWWFELAIATFKDVGIYEQFADFATFFDRLYAFFATADPWYVYADTIPALAHWQAQGLSLGIISNFDTRLFSVLEALGLADFFSTVTISTAVGAAKPDPDVFMWAIAKYPEHAAAIGNADSAPKPIWHIGDSLNEDYAGAIAANFEAIWLNRGDRLPENQPMLKSVTKLTDLILLS